MNNSAQSSFEYLTILGTALGITILIGAAFIVYSNEAKSTFDFSQVVYIGDELIDNVQQVYFLGRGNKFLMNAKFPAGIHNLTIVHVNKSGTQIDYFNFLFITEDGFSLNEIVIAEKTYIRFNCTRCYSSTPIGGNWTNWYKPSDYGKGPKKISIESKGDWVSVDFVD